MTSRNDSYWADGGDGKGRNQLGKILMQVREELRQTENCRGNTDAY